MSLCEFDQIIISPHGIWHNLPIHVLLLPFLWGHGVNPTITYSPSIHSFYLLQQRAVKSERIALNPIGLSTVPGKEDDAIAFAQAHASQTERPLFSAYGVQATTEYVLQNLGQVGLQHLLAHGRYEQNDKVMNSGLLLAGESDLPSKILISQKQGPTSNLLSGTMLMANESGAGHVTVQACSLGRTQFTLGDELWGVTRALLASGVNSVLAPMWDIDLESSTTLLCKFYENWLIQGQPKWRALAEAQRHLANSQEHSAWRHFYHWAAFQIVGC